MKRSVYLAVIVVLGLSSVGVLAQGTPRTESFTGVVKAVSGSSVTVERGSITGMFAVDAKTHVAARGATAKTKENQAAGKPGLTVPDVVHVGDQVTVKFQERSSGMVATDIMMVASLSKK